MEEAYSAADLVVSRSGASSLSEVSHFGLPSVLIPYPFATDDHQSANAAIFTRAGAAESLDEKQVTPAQLATLLHTLLSDPARRQVMSEAAKLLDPKSAAENVADAMEHAAWKSMK
jgi:UDP-N-acetylglucosamine--N-acetylmuramyl-(pentapeptide) pyrophosphoryl-undecaprenol N-acetylglucosamine transferase